MTKPAAGARASWTALEAAFGKLLLAGTEAGVCCLLFADATEEAESLLRGELPGVDLRRDDAALEPLIPVVRSLLDGSETADVPLDLIGTPFQLRVWMELRRIPAGETRTYADVARLIGRPSAVRAVAGACARNHAAVLVPCHRVVRADGALGGYKWGVERKSALLRAERQRLG